MKLGAANYLEWPLDPGVILGAIKTALSTNAPPIDIGLHLPHGGAGLAASTRWAAYVLKAVDSPEDPKTLSAWARCSCVSYTALREACYLLGIQPEDARDFARALRVVVAVSRTRAKLTTLLDTPDRRSLRAFCQRTGVTTATSQVVTLDEFLPSQTLIPRDNEGLMALEQALKMRNELG